MARVRLWHHSEGIKSCETRPGAFRSCRKAARNRRAHQPDSVYKRYGSYFFACIERELPEPHPGTHSHHDFREQKDLFFSSKQKHLLPYRQGTCQRKSMFVRPPHATHASERLTSVLASLQGLTRRKAPAAQRLRHSKKASRCSARFPVEKPSRPTGETIKEV